jgi:molybdenum cofactor cytidylyltransferase
MANVEALVMAAGLSSRMGTNKLLVKINGKTVIEQTAAVAMASSVSGVTMVVGKAVDDIKTALSAYPVNFIDNPDYASGMSSSVKAGIRSVLNRKNVEAVLMMLGDMPLVSTATLNQLITEFENSRNPIIAPRYQGRRGNPVLFSREVFSYMLTIEGDKGAREVLDSLKHQVKFLDVDDPGIVIDLDTKEDLRSIGAESRQ